MKSPVLLPPEEGGPRPLPRWVVPVALLGLAVVASSLVPAALDHRRLEAYHARLLLENRRNEEEVMRLARRLQKARTDRFVRDQELQRLLNPR